MTESGIASGIRRIEAVCGAAALEYLNTQDAVVRALASSLKVDHVDAWPAARYSANFARTLMYEDMGACKIVGAVFLFLHARCRQPRPICKRIWTVSPCIHAVH